MSDEAYYNRVGGDRIASRQMDELIGLARGLCADGILNQSEVEFLQSWLAANLSINDQPVLRTLWSRVSDVLADGVLDQDEHVELFETLQGLGGEKIELGEQLKPSTLPLCNPAPELSFAGRQYAFTGTFAFGKRGACEKAVQDRGGEAGSVRRTTDVLVIGSYVTDSWKHSSMGDKILKACELRSKGVPISIVSEEHWLKFL